MILDIFLRFSRYETQFSHSNFIKSDNFKFPFSSSMESTILLVMIETASNIKLYSACWVEINFSNHIGGSLS